MKVHLAAILTNHSLLATGGVIEMKAKGLKD